MYLKIYSSVNLKGLKHYVHYVWTLLKLLAVSSLTLHCHVSRLKSTYMANERRSTLR